MKKIKKIISFILVVSTLITFFAVSAVYADSTIRKGTTRVVVGNEEVSNCTDVVVYNNNRYLRADYFTYSAVYPAYLSFADFSGDTQFYKHTYKESNKSITVEYPALSSKIGYTTFWAGSKNVTTASGTSELLVNPVVFYDKQAYVSLADIANALSVGGKKGMYDVSSGRNISFFESMEFGKSGTVSYGFDFSKNTIYFY